MNAHQALWWQQARSDLGVLFLFRRHSAEPCHQLLYLQMVCEKLGKAYFWRAGVAPPLRHGAFVRFLRTLGDVPQEKRQLLAEQFDFARFAGFRNWIRAVLPLAYSLERLSPSLAGDGPNAEYPWPHEAPAFVPATYAFDVWKQLSNTSQGRRLIWFVARAVERFPIYG